MATFEHICLPSRCDMDWNFATSTLGKRYRRFFTKFKEKESKWASHGFSEPWLCSPYQQQRTALDKSETRPTRPYLLLIWVTRFTELQLSTYINRSTIFFNSLTNFFQGDRPVLQLLKHPILSETRSIWAPKRTGGKSHPDP